MKATFLKSVKFLGMEYKIIFLSTISNTFLKLNRSRLLLFTLLFLFIITVEMRPSRLYYIVSVLYFRFSQAQFLGYLFLVLLTAWAIFTVLLNQSASIRRTFTIFLFPLLWISITYRLVTGYNFLYADALTLLSNPHLTMQAIHNFASQAFYGFLITSTIYQAGYAILKRYDKVYPPSYGSFFLLVTLLGALQIKTTAGIVDDYPAAFRVPLSLLIASLSHPEQKQREGVPHQATDAGVKHLIFVVDESITGGMLSINGHSAPTTPYLQQSRDIINFGMASAYTNNSAGSNIALVSGARMEELPNKSQAILSKPNIFQYAKNAGYTTYFFDAQTANNLLQNFMTQEDHKYIDHFIQPATHAPTAPYFELDYIIADSLIRLAGSQQKVFIYVNKVGAHWPYPATYPNDSVFFAPVLSARTFYRDKTSTLNTYYNSIRWTVDEFWKKLLQGISASDSTVLVYTSDHGQDFSGNSIGRMHGTIYQSNPQEAEVPVWVVDRAGFTSPGFTPKSPDKYAHQQIFPTLLLMMGYPESFTQKEYGSSLFDPAPQGKRHFISGDVFGRGTHKKTVFD
jgi:glucan phosphoethanolaminetransferase (alkaline phosphatase superfamily)